MKIIYKFDFQNHKFSIEEYIRRMACTHNDFKNCDKCNNSFDVEIFDMTKHVVKKQDLHNAYIYCNFKNDNVYKDIY